jgi:ADP-heptose:LPS heptosyltransferase
MVHNGSPKFLVIRRDNIGDLVCTTPMIAALRRHYPDARIAALVNSYNAPVLAFNPDINECFAYRKTKHREPGQTRLGVWWSTLQTIRRLRAETWDAVFLATTSYSASASRFAHSLHAKRVIGYGGTGRSVTDALPETEASVGHECEAVMRLLKPLGIIEHPSPVRVFADPMEVARAKSLVPQDGRACVGLHLSARKPAQRWPVEHFAELARCLVVNNDVRILLFWSPGGDNHPLHPGDDIKAQRLLDLCDDLPISPFPTQQLNELIAGLSLCETVICSDGGAMHLAAGLGKRIVCFFGNSSAERWHPWGVPYKLLQKHSADVADINVSEAFAVYAELMQISPSQSTARCSFNDSEI